MIFCAGSLGAQTKSVQETQFGRITVTTSSTLAPQSGNNYSPLNAIDGNNRTAWVEGSAADGIGEWIKVSYDSPKKISSISVANGYGKSATSYSANGRVKDVEIATGNGSFVRTIPDTKEEFKVLLPPGMAGKMTRWVKLTIKSVYPGTKYKDTALGEFIPDLEEHNYE
jgi:hypothetical protein